MVAGRRSLCALIVLTNADSTLAADAVSPEATKLNLSLGHALVGEKQPSTKDRLGEQIEDSVGDDLLVNGHLAGAIGDTPNTGNVVRTDAKSRV